MQAIHLLAGNGYTLFVMEPTTAMIQLRGVRVHNLQAIDLDLPLGKLIVVTGVSGAGKSSLAFDTLYAEGQRRYIESFPNAARQRFERMEPPTADSIGRLPPAVAVRQANHGASRRATVGSTTEVIDHLRLLLARAGEVVCPWCDKRVERHSPASVAHVVLKMPPGRRVQIGFPFQPRSTETNSAVIDETTRRLDELSRAGFHRILVGNETRLLATLTADLMGEPDKAAVLVDRLKTPIESPERLIDSLETAFREGAGNCVVLEETTGRDWQVARYSERLVCGRCQREFPTPEPALLNSQSPLGACGRCRGLGTVDEPSLMPSSSPRSERRRLAEGRIRPTAGVICPECKGTRLQATALAMRVGGLPLPAIAAFTVTCALEFLNSSATGWSAETRHAAQHLLPPIVRRLQLLKEVGLGYLTLDRPFATLSRGEANRARLAGACGSNLVNLMFVLDEPTAGLHPADRDRLLDVLVGLRDAGNTVVAVEHDRSVIVRADHVVDLGPLAGPAGGRVVYQGSPQGLPECDGSVTGDFLAGRRSVACRDSIDRRQPSGWVALDHVSLHNLNNVSVAIPLGVLCVVTGVSGSGKSSLVEALLSLAASARGGENAEGKPAGQAANEADRERSKRPRREPESAVASSRWLPCGDAPTLNAASIRGLNQLDDVLFLDATPVSRSGKSQAAGVLGIFGEIRDLFAATAEARVKNLTARHFSFSAQGVGGCESCAGNGSIAVDLQFLPDVVVICPDCHGARYRREILEVKYRGLSIAEVLSLTATEAFAFFRGRTRVQRRLKHLKDSGLDYLRLGQSARTLSGGESQRLKLAAFLARRTRARTLIVLEEPTTGLHPRDIERVLECWNLLLAAGHSLLVVEHNLDVIAVADHLIDLGPGAGPAGGKVVTTGTPEEVARDFTSLTGRFLAMR
ncbi:MAG: excinuclease ABC subunit UvrA [Planctomycetaceae bacterium]|nr:excinuclease ABC subunit UvrA [Planctomycetaceae bacterium]